MRILDFFDVNEAGSEDDDGIVIVLCLGKLGGIGVEGVVERGMRWF